MWERGRICVVCVRVCITAHGTDSGCSPKLQIFGERDTAIGKELTYGTENYVKDLTVRYLNASHWVQQASARPLWRLLFFR